MTNNKNEFGRFLQEICEKILPDIQADLLKLYPRYAELADDFRPIIMEWDPNLPNLDFPDTLNFEGRAGFDTLKTLYVDSYEVLARGITLLMGVLNIENRGNFDLFTPHPDKSINKGKSDPFAKTLLKFHTAANGAKLPMLFEDDVLELWLGKTLLPKLRNAIGHNAIKYDQQAGTVTYFMPLW